MGKDHIHNNKNDNRAILREQLKVETEKASQFDQTNENSGSMRKFIIKGKRDAKGQTDVKR